MTKEEIYEWYWKELVVLKRQFYGRDLDHDIEFLNLQKQIQEVRDNLLKKYGYLPNH